MGEPELRLLDGVLWRGRPVPGGRGHALLAALALRSPRTVSVADLVDEVWADDEPAHPEKALQVLVSRVRAHTDAEVVAHGRGYRLGLRADQVDALRLGRLVADASAARAAGDLDVARLQARSALETPVTSAVGGGPLGTLVEEALSHQAQARALLGSVLLARGEAGEALPLLEVTLAQDPADESRLVEVLRAESLVRGVPAALARYAAYAEEMRERVGAEPGAELRRLHADLLARDAPVRRGLKYDATPMVGRDDDVSRIRGLLAGSRVVSIVGAGGLGKTRLAHLVGRVAEQPVVHLVELAGVTSPEGVLPEVAGVLGVRETVQDVRTAQLRADMRSRVVEQLSGPPTLLVLDNCEHLVDAVADLVAFLISATDATRVLTTTRAPLAIAAEQVYLLPQLGAADAEELFGQRARAARPGVRLEEGEVAALVARLDGLPLAIELAAAKVRVMSVTEIERRLEDRFALLSGRDRSAPDRHQTLEAVIAWSWNLLDEDDRVALSRLATFPDGFSLEGAQALLGRDPVPVLTELVDQSMLVVREGERIRYRFLETVREYGLKQLAAAGETDQVRQRLHAWATVTARDLTVRMFSPDQVRAVAEVRAEAGNLAAVLRAAHADGDAGPVIPIAGVLAGLWTIEGDHLGVLNLSREVLDLVVAAPDPPADAGHELRGVLAALVVTTTLFTGTPPVTAVERLQRLGLVGDGSRSDGMVRLLLEVYADQGTATDALDRLAEDPDRNVARPALQWATQAKENTGDLEGAIDSARRGLALCDGADGPWTRAIFDSQLCSLASQLGDWPLAVRHATRAEPVLRALGAMEDVVQLRSVVAFADLAAGRVEEASRVLDEIAAEDPATNGMGWSVTTTGRAELALATGQVDEGLRLHLECLDDARARRWEGMDHPAELLPWVLFAEAVALVAHALHGRVEEVRRLAGQVRASFTSLVGDPAPETAGSLAASRRDRDFPVLGGVLLGYGCWVLAGSVAREESPTARMAAVRLVALGHRFGYHRSLPSMAWDNVRGLVERTAPVVLTPMLEEYAGRPAPDLLDEVRACLAELD